MPQEVLDALLKYDTTYPSGVYEGKMWRRTDGDVSFLLWYSNEPNDPDHCRVNYRKIIVFDWAKAMGVKL